MSKDDDAPPVARSARVKPRSRDRFKRSADQALTTLQRHQAIDPRFDSMFGDMDRRQFENNYKFLREQMEEEEAQRQHRIRCLRYIARRNALIDAGENLEEYDLSDDEREIFGEDERHELALLKLTHAQSILTELEQLKRESQLYKSKTKGVAAASRKVKAKAELMRNEVEAVKAGKKAKPYFPKRSVVKKAIYAGTFDSLEQKGGKHAVERYLSRKAKR